MEFDTNVCTISTTNIKNSNLLLLKQSSSTAKENTRSTYTTDFTTASNKKRDFKNCCRFCLLNLSLFIVLATRRFFSYCSTLSSSFQTTYFDGGIQSFMGPSSNSVLIKRLSDAFSLKLCRSSVFVVYPLLLKISSTLSTAQTSHLSKYSNTIPSTTNNINNIIRQRQQRSVEERKGEKTLVKSTTIIIATQNNNTIAESLPSQVASQAATTAAVVAVVDCSYNKCKTYKKVFTTECDFVTDCECKCNIVVNFCNYLSIWGMCA